MYSGFSAHNQCPACMNISTVTTVDICRIAAYFSLYIVRFDPFYLRGITLRSYPETDENLLLMQLKLTWLLLASPLAEIENLCSIDL